MAEIDVGGLATVGEVLARIDALPSGVRTESAALPHADGRVLAEDVATPHDFPPFEKSLLDGFALADANTVRAVVRGRVLAGQRDDEPLRPGEAVAVMTGAPLPPGTVCVAAVEHTRREVDAVVIERPAVAGSGIARQGCDRPAGVVVLHAGSTLTPARIAVAASVGKTSLLVATRPTVAILSTGDEIARESSGIRDSNGPMLAALLTRLGCEVVRTEVVDDDITRLTEALRNAMTADLAITSGGVSMGEADHVPAVLRSLGAKLYVEKVKMKPGKPFVAGTHSGGDVFGLPGNPVSAFCCTLRFVARRIDALVGRVDRGQLRQFRLENPLPKNGPREFYLPAKQTRNGVHALSWIGSADVFTLADADGLIVRPIDDGAREAGSWVDVLEL